MKWSGSVAAEECRNGVEVWTYRVFCGIIIWHTSVKINLVLVDSEVRDAIGTKRNVSGILTRERKKDRGGGRRCILSMAKKRRTI